MKKRTKITLRTKIYLTIAGLLMLTGVLYASNPTTFSTTGQNVIQPADAAADPTHFFVSQYFDNDIKVVDCLGFGTLYGTLPASIPPILTEKYMAIAPAASMAAGFTPGDLFVTLSQAVFRNRPSVDNTFSLFATWAGIDGGCPDSDHSAITFDKVGTSGFGNKMIITCEGGRVFTVDGTGGNGPPHVTHLTDTTVPGHPTHIEGPAVLPANFGPLGGQIMVADDINSNLYTINSAGVVNYNPFNVPLNTFSGAEQVLVIPEFPCQYCGDRAFFTVATGPELIISYPRSDFDGLGGDILVTTEGSPPFGTFRIHFDVASNSYQNSVFDSSAIFKEGSTFVEGICSPTPTPTPSPTPSPTPTPTVTPTTCGTAFVIGDLDAVVGHKVTFWGAQWWKKNHLSGGTAPASFKGFANCTNPNPPTCGGTWISDPGNSSHPPDTVPADMTVIVSSLITKSGPIESGDIPMMVTIHTDPGYQPNPGHEGTGTVTAIVCQGARPHQPARPARTPR